MDKKLTRESEPEEYWRSEAEQEGKSPWADPIAWVGILGRHISFAL